jgi:hypothetical protein
VSDAPPPGGNITPRWPQTVGGLVYLAVLAATAVGVGLVVLGPWRLGLSVVGGALLLGAASRLVLPRAEAGMLGVRSRAIDVLTLTAVGAALIVLAVVIPNQPPL